MTRYLTRICSPHTEPRGHCLMTSPDKPSFIAGFDSASAMLMATANALHGSPFPGVGSSGPVRAAMRATRWLPQRVRSGIFTVSGASEGVSRRTFARADMSEVAAWAAGAYPTRSYDAVALGSASGALVYLSAALGMPWLPQTTLIPVRQRKDADDASAAVAYVRRHAREFLRRNPDVDVHQMHDPVQDRRMVRVMSYVRCKWNALPDAYVDFLERSLAAQGTLLVTECTHTWPTTTLDERYVFQLGGMGGASPAELHAGGERVSAFLEDQGADRDLWMAPEPDGNSVEAEWGLQTALADSAAAWADGRARLARLSYDQPDALSPLVADLYHWWYEHRGVRVQSLLVSSFAITTPYWAVRTGAVPFWMCFNDDDSLERLERYLDDRPGYDRIVLSLIQNAVRAIGQPPPERWQAVLDRARESGIYTGSDVEQFPYDLAQLGTYDREVAAAGEQHEPPEPLTMQEFEEFMDQAPQYPGVTWTAPSTSA